mgnify:CR=1 FL=1
MYATKIPSDERSLVLRLIEGEEDAFCELYAAYKNRLIYFAMRFLKSREYAEDIFQDAFAVFSPPREASPGTGPPRIVSGGGLEPQRAIPRLFLTFSASHWRRR